MPRKKKDKAKPFREALASVVADNKAALRDSANALFARAITGDVSAIKEIADRLDGKVPSTVGGSTEVGPVRLQVEWKKS